MVFVSLILTVNSENNLEESLNSILNQSHNFFEVICINYNSNDTINDILNKYKENNHLKIITNYNENESLPNLKNQAINEASGKYIGFLTTNNTLYDCNSLEKALEVLEDYDYNILSSNIDIPNKNEFNQKNYPIYNLNSYRIFETTTELNSEEYGIPLFLSKNLFRRKFITENNLAFCNVKYGQDILFLANALMKTNTFISTSSIFCKENITTSEISPELMIENISCYNNLLDVFTQNKRFNKVLEVLSQNIIKIKDIEYYDFSYEEYKEFEKYSKMIIKKCTENNDYFLYKTRRAIRYVQNRIHNKITKFDVEISLIIPSYNVEEYFDDCFISLLNQTFKDFEIIVVDDLSTDSTVDIINYYKKMDSRIRYIQKDRKSGSGGSRNLAMKYAKGKYVQFVDADDWLDLDTLEKLYNLAEKYETDIVMFKLINYDTYKKTFYENADYSISVLDKVVGSVFNLDDTTEELFKIAVGPVNKLYSRFYLESINANFPEHYIHQDNPFFYQTYCDAEKVYLTEEHFYNRRRTNTSISVKLDDTQIGTIEIVEYILKVFINNGLYERFKKPLWNKLLSKLRRRSNQVGEEFKEEYYKKAKRKLFKFMFSYKLEDDLRESLTGDNERYFKEILNSKNYKEFIERF